MGFPASQEMLKYLRNRNTFSPESLVGRISTTPDARQPQTMEQNLAPRLDLNTFSPPPPTPPKVEEEEMPQPTFSSETKSPRATPQADRFIEASNQPLPQRGKPNIWRRLGASIAPPSQWDEALYGSNYTNAMKDRETRLKELGTAAEREDQVNYMRSLDENRDNLTADRTQRTAIMQARLNGGKAQIDELGNVWILTADGRAIDTGRSTMSKSEELQMITMGYLARISAQESAALRRIQATFAGRENLARVVGAEQRQTNAARGGNVRLVPIEIQNRLRELRSRNPELGNRITINEDTGEIEFNNGDWWARVPDMDSATKESILNHLFDGTELPEMIARPVRRRNVFDQATPPTVPIEGAPNAPSQSRPVAPSGAPAIPVTPPPTQGGRVMPVAPGAANSPATAQGMSNRPVAPVIPAGRPSAFTRPENQPSPQEVPDASLPPMDPNMVPGRGSPNQRRVTGGLNENQWRQRAMDELKKQGKVINEQTIRIVSERLKKASNATAK